MHGISQILTRIEEAGCRDHIALTCRRGTNVSGGRLSACIDDELAVNEKNRHSVNKLSACLPPRSSRARPGVLPVNARRAPSR